MDVLFFFSFFLTEIRFNRWKFLLFGFFCYIDDYLGSWFIIIIIICRIGVDLLELQDFE